MTGLACLLFLVSSAAKAEPPKATIRQQAEIVTLIEQARDVVDASEYEPGKYRTAYGKALSDKIGFEKVMGIRDKDTGELLDKEHSIPTEKDLKKISGDWLGRNDEREKYAEAARIVQKAKEKSVKSYQEALDLTRSYYGIGPKGEAGYPINGPKWERERWLAWAPKFSAVPEPHEEGNEKEIMDAFERQPAFIRGTDAAIIFRPTAFFDEKTKRPDPGYLAMLLTHEAMHVNDYRTPDSVLDLRNEPAREVLHRLAVLWFREETFELTPAAWKRELKDIAASHELAPKWAEAILLGKDPYTYTDRKEIFMKLGLSEERKEAISREVEHDAALFSKSASEFGGSGEIQSLEHLREQAQSSFLKGLGAPELMTLIKSWNKARELEAGKQQKEADIVFARAEIEAERCGFRHLRKDDGLPGSRNGFHLEDPSYPGKTYAGVRYYYRYNTGLDRIRMAVLLARACYDGRYGKEYEPKESCNDGLDIINRRWGDPEFRKHLELDVEGGAGMGQGECLLYMRDHLQVPADWKGLTAHVRQAWKSYREGRRGGSTRPQEPSRGNPGGGGPGRGDGGGGIKPNPSPSKDKADDIDQGRGGFDSR